MDFPGAAAGLDAVGAQIGVDHQIGLAHRLARPDVHELDRPPGRRMADGDARKVISIIDVTASFVFTKTTEGQQDIFKSNIPIRLTEKPAMFDLLLTNAVSSQPPPAPNPDPHVTGMISRSNTDYFCTIYLNY